MTDEQKTAKEAKEVAGPTPKAKAKGGWQPIDTADKLAGDLLLVGMPGGRRVVGQWSDALPGGGWDIGSGQAFPATHWQELPDPPAPDKEGA